MSWLEVLLESLVAAGTLAGTGVALWLGLHSISEARQIREAQLKSQSNSIMLTSNTPWTTLDGLGIWNSSREPIFHILALVAVPRGRMPSWEAIVENQVAGDISEALFPDKDFKFGFTPLEGQSELDLLVRFTDARSNVWFQVMRFSVDRGLLAPQGKWQLLSEVEIGQMNAIISNSAGDDS